MKNAVALGTFDGVHKGHRTVLDLPDDCVKNAVVFKEPPKAVISGKKELIMSSDDKLRVLKKIGIDNILILDFNEVKDMSADSFLQFLKDKFSPAVISCGYNYRFGKDGAGDAKRLSEFCRKENIILNCCEPVTVNGVSVSSSMIRGMLKNGEISSADRLLSEDFSFSGEVIGGDKRGRTIGFPTINQRYPKELVSLKFGVYRTKVSFNGDSFEGITNIGIRPTYRSDYIISETHIINFDGDLYGKTVRIIPQRFLRDEKKFGSADELKKQIALDLQS